MAGPLSPPVARLRVFVSCVGSAAFPGVCHTHAAQGRDAFGCKGKFITSSKVSPPKNPDTCTARAFKTFVYVLRKGLPVEGTAIELFSSANMVQVVLTAISGFIVTYMI